MLSRLHRSKIFLVLLAVCVAIHMEVTTEMILTILRVHELCNNLVKTFFFEIPEDFLGFFF